MVAEKTKEGKIIDNLTRENDRLARQLLYSRQAYDNLLETHRQHTQKTIGIMEDLLKLADVS